MNQVSTGVGSSLYIGDNVSIPIEQYQQLLAMLQSHLSQILKSNVDHHVVVNNSKLVTILSALSHHSSSIFSH